jgi:hypothetical protein
MIYHCIYKDECSKKCEYKNIEDPFINDGFDMRIKSLPCQNNRNVMLNVILTSEERIVCSKGLKCNHPDCVLIQNYITKENIGNILWGNSSIYNIACLIDGSTMIIDTSTNCLSIWD